MIKRVSDIVLLLSSTSSGLLHLKHFGAAVPWSFFRRLASILSLRWVRLCSLLLINIADLLLVTSWSFTFAIYDLCGLARIVVQWLAALSMSQQSSLNLWSARFVPSRNRAWLGGLLRCLSHSSIFLLQDLLLLLGRTRQVGGCLAMGSVQFIQVHEIAACLLRTRIAVAVLKQIVCVMRRLHKLALVESLALLLHHKDQLFIRQHCIAALLLLLLSWLSFGRLLTAWGVASAALLCTLHYADLVRRLLRRYFLCCRQLLRRILVEIWKLILWATRPRLLRISPWLPNRLWVLAARLLHHMLEKHLLVHVASNVSFNIIR